MGNRRFIKCLKWLSLKSLAIAFTNQGQWLRNSLDAEFTRSFRRTERPFTFPDLFQMAVELGPPPFVCVPTSFLPCSRSFGNLSCASFSARVCPARLAPARPYPSTPTPMPNALPSPRGPQLQPAALRIGMWYSRKAVQANTKPIKAPNMMSKPWCRKSE